VTAFSRLVEDEHLRIAEQRPRERDPLALPARQPHAVVAQARRVAVGQRADERVGVRLPRGRFDRTVVDRDVAAVGDVLAHRRVEERQVLPDDGDARPPASEVDVVERHAVDRDRAAPRPQQAEQELHDRRLARAGAPDERRRNAGAQPERHARERRRTACGVAEPHAVEADLVRHALDHPRSCPRRPGRREQIHHRGRRRGGCREAHACAVELLHLRLQPIEERQERQHDGQLARRAGAYPQDGEHQRRDEELRRRRHERLHALEALEHAALAVRARREARRFAGLTTEHADRPPRAQHLDDPLRHPVSHARVPRGRAYRSAASRAARSRTPPRAPARRPP
jgi:hypothetical protein